MIFRYQKVIKNLTSRRTLQNLKNRIAGRPKLDFKVLFEPFWYQSFLYSTHPRKPIFCNTYNAKCLSLLLEPSHFGIKRSIPKSCFFKTSSGISFFCFSFLFMRKWSILGPLQNPAGTKIAPQILQTSANACLLTAGVFFHD